MPPLQAVAEELRPVAPNLDEDELRLVLAKHESVDVALEAHRFAGRLQADNDKLRDLYRFDRWLDKARSVTTASQPETKPSLSEEGVRSRLERYRSNMERAELVSGRRLKAEEVDELCASRELKLRAA